MTVFSTRLTFTNLRKIEIGKIDFAKISKNLDTNENNLV